MTFPTFAHFTWNLDLTLTMMLLSSSVVLCVAYGVRSVMRGKMEYDRVEKQGGSALLNKNVMNMTYWGLQPIGDLCMMLGLSPNMISGISFGFGALAGIALGFGHFGTAGFLAAISSLLDAVDGMVARATGVASEAGEVLDASVDRYVEFFFLAGLIYYYHEIPSLVMLCLAALLGSFMVSYSTAKAEALQVTPPRGNMRRSERALYLTLGAIVAPISITAFETQEYYPTNLGYPMIFALAMIALFANISAVQRLYAIAKAVRAREEEQKKNPSFRNP